jgi:hypothetical protein
LLLFYALGFGLLRSYYLGTNFFPNRFLQLYILTCPASFFLEGWWLRYFLEQWLEISCGEHFGNYWSKDIGDDFLAEMHAHFLTFPYNEQIFHLCTFGVLK